MTIEEKREVYKCRKKYVELSDVQTWPEYFHQHNDKLKKNLRAKTPFCEVNEEINNKVSIWRGDITCLESDAIVNAANQSLLGGGGVDGAIHTAAGGSLRRECETLNGCDTGDAKITGGYRLPSKYIIHAVGPIGENKEKLQRCYERCLSITNKEGLHSVAIPCISTGIYGYPNDKAAHVAIHSVRKFLENEETGKDISRVIFCLFMPVDVRIYEEFMQLYFPVIDKPDQTTDEETEDDTAKETTDSQTATEENSQETKPKIRQSDKKIKSEEEKPDAENMSDLKDENPKTETTSNSEEQPKTDSETTCNLQDEQLKSEAENVDSEIPKEDKETDSVSAETVKEKADEKENTEDGTPKMEEALDNEKINHADNDKTVNRDIDNTEENIAPGDKPMETEETKL